MMGDMRQISDDLSRSVVKRLVELQGSETDTAFVKRIGCTREHWSNVKSGRRRVSYEFIRRAGDRFSDIRQIVWNDLTGKPIEAAS
jgi:hypothetical protein